VIDLLQLVRVEVLERLGINLPLLEELEVPGPPGALAALRGCSREGLEVLPPMKLPRTLLAIEPLGLLQGPHEGGWGDLQRDPSSVRQGGSVEVVEVAGWPVLSRPCPQAQEPHRGLRTPQAPDEATGLPVVEPIHRQPNVEGH